MLISESSSPARPEPLTKKRGRRRTPLAPDAPLYARKMVELLAVLDWPSDNDFGAPIGVNRHEVRKWHQGKKPLTLKDKLVIAHTYDVPVNWWEQPDLSLHAVIGRGLGKDEKSGETHARGPRGPARKGGEDALPTSRSMTPPDPHGEMGNWKAELATQRKLLRKQMSADVRAMRDDVRTMCAEMHRDMKKMLQQVLARK